MEFLIQINLIGEKWLQNIKKALDEAKLPHKYVSVIPFTYEFTPEIEGVDYIPYGSTLMTTLAFERGLKGCHFNLDQFNYEKSCWMRDDMLNDEWHFSLEQAIPFLRNYPAGKELFARPSLDLKQFAGTVMECREMADWFEDAMECASTGSYKLEPDTAIVLAVPKVIDAEWRYFIVDGKIITGSMYRAHGQPRQIRETDQDVLDEAQCFADDWLPDACCVMDMALVDGEASPKVIEFNCINSSGFYDHDVKAVFEALHKYHSK